MIINKETIDNLYIGLKANYNMGFSAANPQYTKIATEIASSSGSNQYNWFGDFPMFREFSGERVVHNVKTYDYTLKNIRFEATESLGQDEIEDNVTNMFGVRIREMGRIAALHPDELVFGALKAGATNLAYDGQYFFDTDHPVGSTTVSNINTTGGGDYWYLLDTSRTLKPLVFQRRKPYEFVQKIDPSDDNMFFRNELIYGVSTRVNAGYSFWQMAYASNQTLNATNFGAAEAAMMSITSDNGRPLNIEPTVLVVSPSNKAAAKQLLAQFNDAGADNIYYKAVDLIVTQYVA